MAYEARFINPHRRPGREGWEWELLLSDDGATVDAQGAPVVLDPVRAPVKYPGRPTAQQLLLSVRQLARRLGSATVAQAGGISFCSIDKPGRGTIVFRDGDPDPGIAAAQAVP